MSLKKIVLSATLGLFMIGTSNAMAEMDIGTNEVGFSASLIDYDDFDDEIWTIFGTFGQMIKPNIQAKANVVWISAGGQDFMFLGAGADYLFPETNEVVPYAGAILNLALMDAEDETIEIHGGVKHFVSERASIFAQYNIVNSLGDFGDYTEMRFGLNVYF